MSNEENYKNWCNESGLGTCAYCGESIYYCLCDDYAEYKYHQSQDEYKNWCNEWD